MKIKGITEAQAARAAKSLGFTLYNVRPEGRFLAFVLRPGTAKGEQYRARGRYGRRAWAVCWHGHKAFMDKLFALNPSAIIVSTAARYEGREDYERQLATRGMVGAAFESTSNCECGG